MFLGQRSVQLLSLAGHLSTLDRHEAKPLNAQISKAVRSLEEKGLFEIRKITPADIREIFDKVEGFDVGDNIKAGKFKLKRADGTEINNAYVDTDDFRVVMNEPFSPKEHMEENKEFSLRSLIGPSFSGPGHIWDTKQDPERDAE